MSTSPSAIGNPQSAVPQHPLARQPSDRLIHSGERIELVLRPVTTNSGKTITREVAIHPGAVIILPVLDDGRILLIHNRRHTVHESLLELPAGTLERTAGTPMGVAHEDPAAAAARELTEETGYAAAAITPFGWFYTSPGILTEKMYAFLATGLTPGPQHLEDNEQIATEPFTPDAIRRLIHENKIVDAKSLATLLKYLAGL
ncbi:MAG TPA: NUDIX hydrolase [Phycisphaerae bacterium]|nr:NUDIX hydrolase [Phycisphaerae bacterium]